MFSKGGGFVEGEEIFYLAALSRCPGLGSRRAQALLASGLSPRELWAAPVEELRRLGNLPQNVASALRELRQAASDLPERLAKAVQRIGARVIPFDSPAYPSLLREIFDPPVVLYVRGELLPEAPRIAMVGARRMSGYGEALALDFGEKLAAAGLTVVSGGAYGIDTASHKGALKAQGGKTIAVLGCGVDVVYPASNRRLFQQILDSGGAIISEYAPGTNPLPAFFPARNRIISGLARGTLVVEAARHSGSLITAELALSENRDIYAIPGSVLSEMCRGTNHLIQQGAKLVTEAADILVDYGIEPEEKPRRRKRLSPEARKVYQVLSFDHPLSMDEILLSLPDGEIANLSVLLLQMEMDGLIIQNVLHEYRRAERE